MNRRSFLRNGMIGAAAVGLPAPAWSASVFAPENAADWMRHWQKALAFRVGRMPLAAQAALDAAVAGFVARGYEPRRAGILRYPNTDDWFLYPLELRRARAGLLDLVLPVLQRGPDGAWRHVLTLNSFQLEALCRALPSLTGHDAPALDLLLPAGPWQGQRYPTRLGSVETSVLLDAGGATVTAAIRRGPEIVWSERFASRHSLRCG